jgi:hypothetical protein
MKRFDVTLIFSKGGAFGCVFNSTSKAAAKAQAIEWAKQSGFCGSVKKTEIVEVSNG